jgi:hypothetical protein
MYRIYRIRRMYRMYRRRQGKSGSKEILRRGVCPEPAGKSRFFAVLRMTVV